MSHNNSNDKSSLFPARWVAFGLSTRIINPPFDREYYIPSPAHDLVCEYLMAHKEQAHKYLEGKLKYFDALTLAENWKGIKIE